MLHRISCRTYIVRVYYYYNESDVKTSSSKCFRYLVKVKAFKVLIWEKNAHPTRYHINLSQRRAISEREGLTTEHRHAECCLCERRKNEYSCSTNSGQVIYNCV
ncbi:unnamed protein product [Ixodes pacificus]